jgi:hypothetical protein
MSEEVTFPHREYNLVINSINRMNKAWDLFKGCLYMALIISWVPKVKINKIGLLSPRG